MTNSPNLDIEHLQPNSDQPEVVVNAAIDALDARITKLATVSIGNVSTISLTQDQQAAGAIFLLSSGSPGPSTAVTLTFATFAMGIFVVMNECGQTVTLKYSGQPAISPTLAENVNGIFIGDGINIRKLL